MIALRESLTLALSGVVSAQTLVWSAAGRDPDIYVEGSVIVLGDADGDGVADLASIVQVYGGIPPLWCSQIWTYSGATGQRIQEFCPELDPAGLVDLTAMGDLDADGFPDFAVTKVVRNGFVHTVRVISWRTGATLWEVSGSATDGFGETILGNIDLNGDGRGDLVINVPRANNRRGEVRAYAHDGTLLHRVVSTAVDSIGGYSGNYRLGLVGDVDGDGCQDYVVAGVNQPISWVAYVISGRTGQVIRRGVATPSEFVGLLCVDGCGDIDGDGVPDFLAGGDWGTGGIVALFSGRDGSRIRTHLVVRDPVGIFARNVRGGGVDLDHDGVPDYLVGSPNDVFRVFSGRTGEVVISVPDEYFSGHFAVAVPPQPGSSFGLVAFTDRHYHMGQGTLGRLRVVRASHPAQRRVGLGCVGTLGHEPQLGMIDRGNRGVRLHLTAGADAGGVVLLGLSSTSWGGLPLPLRLDGLGFTGCSLHGSVEAIVPVALSASGPNGGYGFLDIPWPLQFAGGPPRFRLVAQWLAFGGGALWPGAASEALEWWH